MYAYYNRLFFSLLCIIFLQACGGGNSSNSNSETIEDTKQPATATKQTITELNYVDLAKYYFKRKNTLIQVSARIDSLDEYKERATPGEVAVSNDDTFTVFAITPFNEYVEHIEIAHNDMKIVVDVVRKMYVTIKLYKSDTLVTQTEKTLDAFITEGRLMPIGDDS